MYNKKRLLGSVVRGWVGNETDITNVFPNTGAVLTTTTHNPLTFL